MSCYKFKVVVQFVKRHLSNKSVLRSEYKLEADLSIQLYPQAEKGLTIS